MTFTLSETKCGLWPRVALCILALARPATSQTVEREGHAGVRAVSSILDVATGLSRPLPIPRPTRAPRWSPDGRLIAVQALDGDVWNVMVLEADGSSRRTYRVPADLINVQTAWSPRATKIAVRTAFELWVINVADGAVTQVGPSVHPHHLAWIDEEKLVVARIQNVGKDKPWRWQLDEASADGSERMLRNLSMESADTNGTGESHLGFFVGPRAYVVINPRRVVVDAFDRDDTLPGSGPRSGAPGYSKDARALVFGVGPDGEPVRSIEFIDVARRTSSVRQLPFLARTTAFSRPAMLPDGSSAIVLGRANARAPWAFYLVPRSGGSIRQITTIPGDPTSYHFDLSPDGKKLLYTYDRPTAVVKQRR